MTEPQSPISSKPPCSRDDALLVVKRLRESGHIAYFAGGCVRDELWGIQPKDYDVATDAPPTRVRELFKNTQAVGAAFGVILVRQGKSVVEVATFRSDGTYLDGRRPSEVHFTTAEEDAKRRDFTINGLFFDPIENKVIDFVGGQSDLRAGILRAIGDPSQRFQEDHLRLLRAIRFAARFEFEIEPATAEAIRTHAPHLKGISPERIADELRGTLTLPEQGGDWAWHALLIEFPGLSDVLFRFLTPPPDMTSREKRIHVFNGFSANEQWPFALCLAAVTLDWILLQQNKLDLTLALEKPSIQRMCRAMRQSLRLSNDEIDTMFGALEGTSILLKTHPLGIVAAKRFLARSTARLSRMLISQLSCHIGAWRIKELNEQLESLLKTDYAPTSLITGDDLTAAGLKPGKLFKRILNDVYDAQLESRLSSKEQAIELALRLSRESAQ